MTTVVIGICHNVRMTLSSTRPDTFTSQHPNPSRFKIARRPKNFTPGYPHELICGLPANAPDRSIEEMEEKEKMSTKSANRGISILEQCLFDSLRTNIALSLRNIATHFVQRSDLLLSFAPVGQEALQA